MNKFKEALNEIRCPLNRQLEVLSKETINKHQKTLVKALRIADKLMQEPSRGMCSAARETAKTYQEDEHIIIFGCCVTYRAMRDELIKENRNE